MGDKGEGVVKNVKKLAKSFMDGLLAIGIDRYLDSNLDI